MRHWCKFHLHAPGCTSVAVLIFHFLKQVFQANAEVVWLWKACFVTAGWLSFVWGFLGVFVFE